MQGSKALIRPAAVMTSMGMGALIAAIAVVPASPTLAAQIIRCTAPGQKGHVDLALDAERKIGHTVSCIYGVFAPDIVTCAPAGGGYGQTSGAGLASLVEIATDQAGFRRFAGPVVGHTISLAKISFWAGYRSVDGAWKPYWRFVLDRATGKAVYTLEEGSESPDPASDQSTPVQGRRKISYACRTVRRKF
jgi:hypothetical protein